LPDLNLKYSLVVLFSVALLTGFISVANTKAIFASSIGGIDLGDLNGQPGDGGGNGPDGTPGEPWSGGGNGPDGTPGEPWSGGGNGPDNVGLNGGDRGGNGPDNVGLNGGDRGGNGPDNVGWNGGDRDNDGPDRDRDNDGPDRDRWNGGDRGGNGPDRDRGDSETNGQSIGFLNIKKNVIGDNRPASDFRLNIEGNNPSKTPVAGSPDGVDVIVGEGDYRVTEQPIAGYTTTYSEGCEGDITMNSQREVCVVTNTATATGN
jgi:hypothetical protein